MTTNQDQKPGSSLFYHAKCIMCENMCLNSTGVCGECRKMYGVKNKTRVSSKRTIEPDKTVKSYLDHKNPSL